MKPLCLHFLIKQTFKSLLNVNIFNFYLLGSHGSTLTLDSIDDWARYSDDGLHGNDEKITGKTLNEL